MTDIRHSNSIFRRLSACLPAVLCLFTLILISCRTLTPPGFRPVAGGLETVFDSSSAEARLALTWWFLEVSHPDDLKSQTRQTVQDAMLLAAAELNRRRFQEISGRHPELLQSDENGLPVIVQEAVLNCQDSKAIEQELQDIADYFQTPCRIEIPLEEALTDKYWSDAMSRLSFINWANACQTLEVPASDQAHRDAFCEELSSLLLAVKEKNKLIEVMAQADSLLESGDFTGSLALIDEAVDDAVSRDIQQYLDVLSDQTTIQLLREKQEKLPARQVSQELATVQAALAVPLPQLTEERLRQVEHSLSQAIFSWRQDVRFQIHYEENLDTICRLSGQAADLRYQFWSSSYRNLFEAKEYWQASCFFNSCLDSLASEADGDYLLYAIPSGLPDMPTAAEKLTEQLRQMYFDGLDQAVGAIYDQIENALTVHSKPGLGYVLCQMIECMLEVGASGDLPGNAAVIARQAETMMRYARSLTIQQCLRRPLVISNFTSPVPGLGLTYARDLEHSLKPVIEAFGLDALHPILNEIPTGNSPCYTLFGGVIADFDGNETSLRETTRFIRRHSAIRRQLQENASPEGEGMTSPVQLFSQDEYEQSINVQVLTKLVHIRLFFSLKGNGEPELLEFNEFYPREFVSEKTNPATDIHLLQTSTARTAEELPPADDPLVLRSDLVLSSAELLDFARKDSLNTVSVKILRFLGDQQLAFLHQVKDVPENLDPMETTERLGQLLCYLENRKTDSPALLLPFRASQPVAKCYEEEVAAITAQQDEFRQATGSAAKLAYKYADLFLHETAHPQNANGELPGTACIF